MSGLKYQTLLGESSLDADSIVVESLVAEKGIIASLDVTKSLRVDGITELMDTTIEGSLTLPTGAADGHILTSDPTGKATWKANDHSGDITGPATATVQHHKWIGRWSPSVEYKRYNRVTFNHTEYRALNEHRGGTYTYQCIAKQSFNV